MTESFADHTDQFYSPVIPPDAMTKSQKQQFKKLMKKGIYLQLHQQGLLTDEQLNRLLQEFAGEIGD